VSVRRSSGPSLGRPGMIGQEGDLLYLAVQKEALDDVNEQFAEVDLGTRRL
jgi:hypothetical protein